MIGRWVEISPKLLERLRAEPDVLDEVRAADLGLALPAGASGATEQDVTKGVMKGLAEMLDPENLDALAGQLPAEERAAFLNEAESVRAAASVGPQPEPEGIRSRLSLEQAWHGVHFLMCETADKAPAPLGNAVLGGSEVGPDEGFGPVRFLTPDQVVNVATAITELRAADLRRRWNPGALSDAQVYPGAWDDEDSLEWMINAFTELREFYVHAGENGSAVLIYVT